MSFWSEAAKLIVGDDPAAKSSLFHHQPNKRDIMRQESKIGSDIFGAVPAGHIREFFYFDSDTWIWYEEWPGADGKRQSLTTRYEVHSNGVLKVQDNQPYAVVEGVELRNLLLAMRLYYERTTRQVYKRDPATRQPI
jgi:hypothetical protein